MTASVSVFPGVVDAKAVYQAEQDVIAACVRDPVRLSTVSIEPKHFTAGPNRELWECLLALHAEGEIIDAITVAERCESMGKYENYTYLAELLVNCSDSNFEYKANMVWRRSQSIELWRQIERALHTKDEATIVRCAEAIQTRTAAGSRRAVQADMQTAVTSMIEGWIESRQRPKFTWGLLDLDKTLKPMEPTRLYVAMARPGMGKTAFALNVALANARAGTRVGFISVEQSMEELAARAMCIISGCPIEWVKMEEEIPQCDFRRIELAKQELTQIPLIVNDATPMTIAQLQGWARSLVQRNGVEMLVVDYIQKIHGDQSKERHMEVAHVVMGLKDIARQHKVPVLALAQARRDAEGKRPTMADCRDSGFIEQEADVIIAIHREQDDEGERSDKAELIVLKNRHGRSDFVVNTLYRGQCYRFENYAGRYA